MKISYKLIIFLVVVTLFTFWTLQNQTNLTVISNEDLVHPHPDAVKVKAKLYFVVDDILKDEERVIEYDELKFEGDVMRELEKGPKNRGYQSPFGDNVYLISAEAVADVCYVNVSSGFLSAGFWESEEANLYVWSIVNTLTELDHINSVQFLFEGKKVNLEVGSYNFNEPLPRIDDYIYVKKIYASDVVLKFIDSVSSKRYDIAYEYIDSRSKELILYKDFVEMMEEYNQKIKGYKRIIYFTQEFSENRIVYIKYVLDDTTLNDRDPIIYENWEVIEEDGQWKINFQKFNFLDH